MEALCAQNVARAGRGWTVGAMDAPLPAPELHLVELSDHEAVRAGLAAGMVGVALVMLGETPAVQLREARHRDDTVVSELSADALSERFAAGEVLVGMRMHEGSVLAQWARRDDPGVLSAEASTGVSLTSVLIIALSVLVSFGLDQFAAGLTALLCGGLLVCLAAAVAYANCAAAVSDTGASQARRYLQVGNVLSEFGGVALLVVTLPVVVATKTGSLMVAVCAGVVAAVVYAYLAAAKLDITRLRFGRVGTWAITLAVSVLPLLGVAADTKGLIGGWSGVAAGVLILATVVSLTREEKNW